MRLPGLKHCFQSEQLHGVDDFPRQRVLNRLLGAHATALGARLAGVEVERVEALVVLVVWWWGGIEGCRLGLAGGAERRGWGDIGGADEGVGEVVWVLLRGVGVGIGVGEFFYSSVLGHVEWYGDVVGTLSGSVLCGLPLGARKRKIGTCNILSLNIPVTDELLVIRLVDLLGPHTRMGSVDYRL